MSLVLVVVTHSVDHALRLLRGPNLYLKLVQCAVVKIMLHILTCKLIEILGAFVYIAPTRKKDLSGKVK